MSDNAVSFVTVCSPWNYSDEPTEHWVCVKANMEIMVWDEFSQSYFACHILTEVAKQAIRKQAKTKKMWE